MIRFIHTADWHLGQSFHGFDRDFEHSRFLKWLESTLIERKPDALLIAGDIFDSVNPSAVAQRRFYDFLASVHSSLPLLQIVLIAGNHDAAARLEAPSDLLESLQITVIGTVARDESATIDLSKFLVPLKDSSGTVQALALAIPFLRPSDVPYLPEASDLYLDGIRELYRLTTAAALEKQKAHYPGVPLLAFGHCHMQEGAESRDSERRLIIGGAEALKTDIFPPELAYVALGHLHKPQKLDSGRICYSGSPIPLSFSEKDYYHQVFEGVLQPGLPVELTSLPIPKSVKLLCIPPKAAPIQEVLDAIEETSWDASLPPEQHPFVEIRILDDGPDPTRRRKVELALHDKPVRLASIKLDSPKSISKENAAFSPIFSDLSALDPETIMSDAHRELYQSDPDPALLDALREILASTALD